MQRSLQVPVQKFVECAGSSASRTEKVRACIKRTPGIEIILRRREAVDDGETGRQTR